jgi:hypothetical protein
VKSYTSKMMAICVIFCFAATNSAYAKRKLSGGADATGSPAMSFATDRSTYQPGERALLSWASVNTRFCNASGAWDGKWPTEGVFRTPPLQQTGVYDLKCSAKGGGVSAQIVLTVIEPDPVPEPDPASAPEPDPAPEPAPEPVTPPEPSITFSTSQDGLLNGERAALSWTTTNADSCTADGSWSGDRAINGSTQVGPIDAGSTFSLTCSGQGGSALAMLKIDYIGMVQLNWVAPSENVDGSPLTDLTGYRIYYGQSSREYDTTILATEATATSQSFQARSGEYFVSMTAVDVDGNESGYSNEVLKQVP